MRSARRPSRSRVGSWTPPCKRRWAAARSRISERSRSMSFMQVSRKVDYALRAVIHLADDEHRGRACSVPEIAERERIPKQFLEKIIRDLIRSGLVRSQRGPHGGYVLARPAEEVTFRHVIEAV